MKGCLKSAPATRSGTPTNDHPPLSARKCVAFQAEACLETFFTADDWDRTPSEPSKKLSYQDLLELKEIQRSLPIADQPADPLSGRAGRRYLTGVPITLVPLLPESDSSISQKSPTTPTQTSPTPTSPWMAFSPSSRQSLPPTAPTSPPFRGFPPTPHSSHSQPPRQQAPKPKPRFAFLPLLDSPTSGAPPARSRTPSPARSDPPTPSLTNTSLESSPMSQASTCSSSEPPFFQLPPPKKRFSGYCQDEDCDSFPTSLTSVMQSMNTQKPLTQGSGSIPPPPFPFEPNRSTCFGRSNPAFKVAYPVPTPAFTTPKPKKQRNVIVVNGIEIDLDGDDSPPSPPAPAPKPQKKRNVIFVNGIEMDLGGSDDEDEEPQKPSTPQPKSPASSSPRSSPSSPSSITSNGLPTPPPSTSPSPTLSQRTPLPPTEDVSPFSGLHAPIRFKRAAPAPAPSASSSMTIACSPPKVFLSSSPSQRRGSFGSRQQQ